MKKSVKAKSDVYLALIDFRNTPTEKLGSSPAQRLLGRHTRNKLPIVSKLLLPEVLPTAHIAAKIEKGKEVQAT